MYRTWIVNYFCLMMEVVVAVMWVTLYTCFYVLTQFLHNLIVLKMEMIQLIKSSKVTNYVSTYYIYTELVEQFFVPCCCDSHYWMPFRSLQLSVNCQFSRQLILTHLFALADSLQLSPILQLVSVGTHCLGCVLSHCYLIQLQK